MKTQVGKVTDSHLIGEDRYQRSQRGRQRLHAKRRNYHLSQPSEAEEWDEKVRRVVAKGETRHRLPLECGGSTGSIGEKETDRQPAGKDDSGRKRKRDESSLFCQQTLPPVVKAARFVPAVSTQTPTVAKFPPPKVSPELVKQRLQSSCGDIHSPQLDKPAGGGSLLPVKDPPRPKLKEGTVEIAPKVPLASNGKGLSSSLWGAKGTVHHQTPGDSNQVQQTKALRCGIVAHGGLLDLLQKRDNELMQQYERIRSLDGKNNGLAQNLQSKLTVASKTIEALFGEIEWIQKLRNGAIMVHDQMLVRLADAEEAVEILRKESELTKRDYKRLVLRVRAKHAEQLAKIRAQQDEAMQNIRREHGATLALLQLEMDKRGEELERIRGQRTQNCQSGQMDKLQLEKSCIRKDGLLANRSTKRDEDTKMSAHIIEKLETKLKKSEELVEQLRRKLYDADKTIGELRDKNFSMENAHSISVKDLKEKHSHQLAELSSAKEAIVEQTRQDCSAVVAEKDKVIDGLKLERDSALLDLGAKIDAKDLELQTIGKTVMEQKARINGLESQLKELQQDCDDQKKKHQQEVGRERIEQEKLSDMLDLKKQAMDQLDKEHSQRISELSSSYDSRIESIVKDKDAQIAGLRGEVEKRCALVSELRKAAKERDAMLEKVKKAKHASNKQAEGQEGKEQQVTSETPLEQPAGVAIESGNVDSRNAVLVNTRMQHSSPKEKEQSQTKPPISGVRSMVDDSAIVDNNNSDVDVTNVSPISEESALVGSNCTSIGAACEEVKKGGSSEWEQRYATYQGQNCPGGEGKPEVAVVAVTTARKGGEDEDKRKLKERIDTLLKTAVPQEVVSRFRQVAFAEWTGRWLPAIELGPYDVTPGSMRKQWLTMAEKHAKTGSPMKRLVYWYGVRNMMEAYSFLPSGRVISYEDGVKKGYDEIPRKIQAKLEASGEESRKRKKLSPAEKHRVNALLEMRWEAKLEPRKRVSWAKWD